ncbi:MAG: BON domain-containing protein, partial [Desulfobacterales bacterium]
MAKRKTKRHLAVPAALAALLIGFVGFAFAEKALLTNQQISNAIDWDLIKDPATPADDITVSAANGIVTLNGTVDNIMAKERAEAIAETVKGVRAIVNRIVVTAPFRSDADIEKDVKQALIWDSATESWEISATVKDGVATLNGAVDSWQEKILAGKVVKGVRGVKGIENNIAVDYATQRSDAEIREEIKKTLRWDVYLDDALIDIDVKDGKVTLTGTVGSLAEKSRAWTDAWVAGVKSVDNSDLQV